MKELRIMPRYLHWIKNNIWEECVNELSQLLTKYADNATPLIHAAVTSCDMLSADPAGSNSFSSSLSSSSSPMSPSCVNMSEVVKEGDFSSSSSGNSSCNE